MKTLLLLRHGKSSWKEKDLPDKKRPLKKRGINESIYIGKALLENVLVPQVILSSPAVRAHDTAEQVAKACGFKQKIVCPHDFYMAEPSGYIQELKALPDDIERVLVVGHNPGLEALLQYFDGKIETLPTGALAYLSMQLDSWSNLSLDSAGELVGFWHLDKAEEAAMEEEMAKEKKDKKDKKEKKEKKGKKGKK